MTFFRGGHDKSSCPGIWGAGGAGEDLSRHEDSRETDLPRMCLGLQTYCSGVEVRSTQAIMLLTAQIYF